MQDDDTLVIEGVEDGPVVPLEEQLMRMLTLRQMKEAAVQFGVSGCIARAKKHDLALRLAPYVRMHRSQESPGSPHLMREASVKKQRQHR